MALTIGLLGFGRIGRDVFRIVHRSDKIRVGAIADPADHEALTYLLKFDTILGRFPSDVRYEDGRLYTWGREIPFLSASGPEEIDWSEYGVDYVVVAVGRPLSYAECAANLEAGARRVVLCVPPREKSEITVVFGVNDDRLEAGHRVISNGSCTAHCAAPVLDVLDDAFGIESAHLSVVHAFTRAQRLADVPADDLRLSRAAGMNIVPGETNAASVLEDVLPKLRGRLHASALRAPVANGSIVDMSLWFEKEVSAGRINEVVRSAAAGPYRGILEYMDEPIVSSDVMQSPYSSTFDAQATMVLDGRLAKTISWFDNSWGYSHRVTDLVRKLAEMDGVAGEEQP
jgi:glyceraldehyde 3-phosphate dehydrogenase